MLKLILIICLSFTYNYLFSQEDIKTDSVKNSNITINQDDRINNLEETYISSYKLMGYRIQIHSGTIKQKAKQARSTYIQVYKKPKAHAITDVPYFKVRVGDFKTKIEALKFKNELVKHFPNCFIVRDEIDYKEITN